MREIDEKTLWDIALHGNVTNAAMALTILDEKLGGKITELKNRLPGKNNVCDNNSAFKLF